MEEIEVVRQKVERYTRDIFQKIETSNDGHVHFKFESTRIEIRVRPLSTGNTDAESQFHNRHGLPSLRVEVWAFILLDVPRSQGLFKWVATEGQNWNFGGARVILNDDGLAHLVFSYSIAGNTLDPGELKNAVLMVSRTSNNLDEELQERFGGKRYIDYILQES